MHRLAVIGEPMKFCNQCSAAVNWQVPEGDSRARFVCSACQTVHYENPKIVAGCIPVWGEQVLLCRRAIEPRKGFWTVPAGFMENGESMAQAAMRETYEEACANVEQLDLYAIYDLPQINQVHTFFRAKLTEPQFAAGIESLEVALFSQADIPWSQLAFPTIGRLLECYFADRDHESYPVRNESIEQLKPYFAMLGHKDHPACSD